MKCFLICYIKNLPAVFKSFVEIFLINMASRNFFPGRKSKHYFISPFLFLRLKIFSVYSDNHHYFYTEQLRLFKRFFFFINNDLSGNL